LEHPSDHEVETASEGGRAIRDRLASTDRSVPLVLTGDFNCAAGNSRAFEILTGEAGLADTWALASTRVNEGLNTFNGFQPAREGVRIDWVLLRGKAGVSRAEIVTIRERLNPSDHFPVVDLNSKEIDDVEVCWVWQRSRTISTC
jgi:endonuclease/exonuclease/phosphatase family metal-dependent hydrolase